ncbi:uncharacterized protein LOC134245018 [Saccostrea cucullata]|uniref:uncharacterized protein LOC134245018 n=1 Tax=Saccostrea cuccullata TaxID=36930 RepID=UPI002ED22EF5
MHFFLDITSLKGHKILWKDCQETEGPSVDFDGTPYINIGWMVKECHQGPDRQRKAKGKRKQRKKSGDHNYSNQRKARKWIQMSKKQTCPASIRIRVILKFPEFKVDSYDNAWIKRKMSRLLKQAFANREKVKKDMVYLLSYPDAEEHKYHFTGELAGYTQQIDPRLIRKIQELVADGVRNVAEMRRHLCVALKKEICPGENIALTNRRFYPKDKDIKNHMDKALNSLKFSKDDQLNLEALIENWQETNPQDNYFLRSSYGLTDKHPAEEFLFVHQTEWQRRLLSLYGKDVCIMDATYKTSKYALPLFFVCVQTNVGHSICGSFLVSSESKSCIKEGLNKLKQWNPNWSPKYFITDYDEREIQAIEEAFQDCFVYLCAFHREQAWTRWLKQIKNEVGRYQDDIIELMRKVANSPSECSYKEAVVDLRGHPHWQENLKMRTWFEKKWLSVSNRWVKAFRDETVTLITTTNALERKHQEFKKGYLSHFSEGSLCALVTALVTKFLPDSYRSYLNNNIQCLEYCRKYADGVPTFLHNKPRMFVEHCLKRIPPHIQNIPPSNIEELGERKYAVHSVESGKIYSVVITSTQPACTCVDYSIHHLPCKHMLAIFSCVPDCSWNDLPEAYKNNPHFNLDEDILQQSEVNPMSPSPIPEEHLNDSPEDSEHQVASPPASKCTTEEIITSNKENYARPQHIILKESISALKDLQSDLYLVNNTADLEDICQKILELRSYISRKIPKDSGLKLQKGAKSGRLSLKRKPKSLPLNRKYKKPKKNHHVQFVEEDEIIVLDGTFDNPSCEFSQSNNPGEAKHTDFIPDDSCSPEMFDCAKVQEETSHQTLDVETLWKVKPVGYLVAKIATNKIMDNSIQFLKTSLSDEVIDAYLHLLVESKKNKKMFCITSSVATAIFEGRTEHFQGYMSDVKFSDFDIILAAINENYGHWTLLVIYPSEKRLLYINSLGESKRNLTNIGEKWRKYILGRRSVGVSELSHEGWKVETTKHTKQYDSNSCGVYVVKFAELVISDMALSFSCRPDNLSQIRQGIGNQLLQATGRV